MEGAGMSKKERIEQLEDRVRELTRRLEALEGMPPSVVPAEPFNPYWGGQDDSTGWAPPLRPKVWCQNTGVCSAPKPWGWAWGDTGWYPLWSNPN